MEAIALNAIRWRSQDGKDSEVMAKADRKWLLAFIERHTKPADPNGPG